jgi:acetyl-CoA carboxylase carboxyltransferase component
MTTNLGLVPVVGACMGVAAGGDAGYVPFSHFSVMVRGSAQLFVAGPAVVKAALGVEVTSEELGGSEVHGRSGAIDNVAESETDAFEQIRRFLSFLPQNVYGLAPRVPSGDPVDRTDEELADVIPRNPRRMYDARRILAMVFDRGSLFEMTAGYGGAIITAFARLDGWPVGVLASNPRVLAGALDGDAATKMTRFVDLCETFHLPIVSIADQPGIALGPDEERRGAIRHAARAIAAVYQTSVPMIEVIVRRVFGVGGVAMVNMNGHHPRLAWPSGRWGSLPSEGGIEAAFRAEIAAADDPHRFVADLMARVRGMDSPFRTAAAFELEDVIDPRETRPMLCSWVNDSYAVLATRTLGPYRHGVRP